jgi:hypothetical protein
MERNENLGEQNQQGQKLAERKTNRQGEPRRESDETEDESDR